MSDYSLSVSPKHIIVANTYSTTNLYQMLHFFAHPPLPQFLPLSATLSI